MFVTDQRHGLWVSDFFYDTGVPFSGTFMVSLIFIIIKKGQKEFPLLSDDKPVNECTFFPYGSVKFLTTCNLRYNYYYRSLDFVIVVGGQFSLPFTAIPLLTSFQDRILPRSKVDPIGQR